MQLNMSKNRNTCKKVPLPSRWAQLAGFDVVVEAGRGAIFEVMLGDVVSRNAQVCSS
jgi:hypothetical protein